MNQINQQHAYQYGAHIASLWKKLKIMISNGDRHCVTWFRKRNLPGWLGHIPVIIVLLITIAAVLLGGMVIAGCTLFICAIMCILLNVDVSNIQFTSDANEDVDGYQNGPEGGSVRNSVSFQ